jgi:hypothetical protein
LEDSELVAEGQDLGLEFGPSAEAGTHRCEESSDAWAHDWCTVSAEVGKLNRHKVYGVFDRDNSHFRRAVREYVEHYHLERNHQGLGNTLIAGTPARFSGAIRRRPRMGGLLNYYERAA